MKPIKTSQDIVPIDEFKTHASRIIRELKTSHQPVVITQNGKAAAVLVTPEDFDDYRKHAFLRAVREGLADAAANRVVDDEVLAQELENEFGPLDDT